MKVCKAVLAIVVLAMSLVGCAGMETCGDSCPVDVAQELTFTPGGASEPMLRFMVPAGTENFFVKPWSYAGGVPIANTPTAALAMFEFQKAIDANGTPGVEAWTLFILTTKGENGKNTHEVLALIHTLKIGERIGHRYFLLNGKLITEGDKHDIIVLITKVKERIEGTGV